MVVRVVDDSNRAHYPATALACPRLNGDFDCGPNAIRDDVNRFGVATLMLKASVSYRVFAVVANPDPEWACPGLIRDGDELYLSNTLEGTATALPKLAKLVIPEPDPLDCVVVDVTDQFGTSLPAGLFLCAHLPGSEECVEGPFEGADPDGVIRIEVNPELLYDLGAFYGTTEWPCPGFPLENGDQLYFGDSGTFDADQLLAGITLVVQKPDPLDCVVVNVTDQFGTSLSAGLFVCGHEPGSDECIGDGFGTTDANGLIRIEVDPTLIYDLRAFYASDEWPCPDFVADDGTHFHWGEEGTFTADQLLAGVTLVVPKPLNCAELTVVDQHGAMYTSAGLNVCAHEIGSTECVGGTMFDGTDADGIVRLDVDPALVYDLQPWATGTGWPCPGWVSPNGDVLHFGPTTTVTGADLLAGGVSVVLPELTIYDCAPVTVTDDSGNVLATAGMWVCGHAPGDTTCIGDTSDGTDPDGIIRLVLDPALDYDLTPWYVTSDWPCPGFQLGNGEYYYGGDTVTLSATEIATGPVTLVVPKPVSC
jgi:hypothetical protein